SLMDRPEKIEVLEKFLDTYRACAADCVMCPHSCGTARRDGILGRCGEPYIARVSSFNLHHGEEPPISGTDGSGTVFFSGCNMKCSYCQNFPISQMHKASKEYCPDELSGLFIKLQERGAHNINLVTPSHYI